MTWPLFFQLAGVYNLVTGLLYLALRRRIAAHFDVGGGADPSDRLLVNLVHVYFGVVAFFIAEDPARDLHLIGLWTATKTTSFGLSIARFVRQPPGRRSWVALAPGVVDLGWAACFVGAIVALAE